MAQETKRVVCEYCKGYCRVLAYTENNRLVKADEDRSYPLVDQIFPPTKACVRLRAAKEIMYHPDRVNFPLKRAGSKGEGKWKQISWKEAFGEIAEKIRGIKDKHGAEAIAGTKGTFRTRNFMPRFFNLLGSPNSSGQGKICAGPISEVGAAMFGWPLGRRGYMDGKPKSVFLVGANPAVAWPRVWEPVREMKKSGGMLIVIDCRRTETAALADLWLQPRPGTDIALLLSMVQVIIEEKLYAREFVEKWCYGFDKLAERAREYPPEKIAEITWVSADKIREAARMLAKHSPHYSWNGMGIEQQQGTIDALQARFILAAITGSIDVEGGNYLPGPGKIRGISQIDANDRLSPEQKRRQLGAERFRFTSLEGFDLILENTVRVWGRPHQEQTMGASAHQPTLYRAMLTGHPYPVRGMITLAHNPMVTQANTKLVYKAIKSLDLYVVLDYWLTPSAELADYVLPAASGWERPFLAGNYGGEQAVPSSIPGEYDHKTDFEIFRELGIRLEQEKDWPWKDLEEVYDYWLEPVGMSFREFMDKGGYVSRPAEFKKYERMGFATPSGKAELYSTIFEKLGYDPLPKYEEAFETPISRPDLAKEYPLMLITGGRFNPLFHSEFRQIDSLRRRHPDPLVQVHPETAKSLGINDGDWVWIESPRGRIKMKCQYFDGIYEQVAHCEHGWWFPELPGEEPWLHGVWESNVNVLMDDDPDHCNEKSGGWPLRTALCKIYKVKQYSQTNGRDDYKNKISQTRRQFIEPESD